MKPVIALAAALAVTTSLAPLTPAEARSRTYTNDYGRSTKAPKRSLFSFLGAKAKCRDGASSYSRHRSGSCSGHGGVRSF